MNGMKEFGRLSYVGDDEKSYSVVEYRPPIHAKALDGFQHTGYGASVYRLSDGSVLYEQAEDMVFKISTNDVIIRPI